MKNTLLATPIEPAKPILVDPTNNPFYEVVTSLGEENVALSEQTKLMKEIQASFTKEAVAGRLKGQLGRSEEDVNEFLAGKSPKELNLISNLADNNDQYVLNMYVNNPFLIPEYYDENYFKEHKIIMNESNVLNNAKALAFKGYSDAEINTLMQSQIKQYASESLVQRYADYGRELKATLETINSASIENTEGVTDNTRLMDTPQFNQPGNLVALSIARMADNYGLNIEELTVGQVKNLPEFKKINQLATYGQLQGYDLVTGVQKDLVSSAFLTGAMSLIDNLPGVTSYDEQTRKSKQDALQMAYSFSESDNWIIRNVIQGAAQSTPSVATAIGLALVPYVGPALSIGFFSVQGASDIYTEAKLNGATDNASAALAATGGILYGASEMLLGKIVTKGATSVAGTALKKVMPEKYANAVLFAGARTTLTKTMDSYIKNTIYNTMSKFVVNTAIDLTAEAGVEMIQEALIVASVGAAQMFSNLATDRDMDHIFNNEELRTQAYSRVNEAFTQGINSFLLYSAGGSAMRSGAQTRLVSRLGDRLTFLDKRRSDGKATKEELIESDFIRTHLKHNVMDMVKNYSDGYVLEANLRNALATQSNEQFKDSLKKLNKTFNKIKEERGEVVANNLTRSFVGDRLDIIIESETSVGSVSVNEVLTMTDAEFNELLPNLKPIATTRPEDGVIEDTRTTEERLNDFQMFLGSPTTDFEVLKRIGNRIEKLSNEFNTIAKDKEGSATYVVKMFLELVKEQGIAQNKTYGEIEEDFKRVKFTDLAEREEEMQAWIDENSELLLDNSDIQHLYDYAAGAQKEYDDAAFNLKYSDVNGLSLNAELKSEYENKLKRADIVITQHKAHIEESLANNKKYRDMREKLSISKKSEAIFVPPEYNEDRKFLFGVRPGADVVSTAHEFAHFFNALLNSSTSESGTIAGRLKQERDTLFNREAGKYFLKYARGQDKQSAVYKSLNAHGINQEFANKVISVAEAIMKQREENVFRASRNPGTMEVLIGNVLNGGKDIRSETEKELYNQLMSTDGLPGYNLIESLQYTYNVLIDELFANAMLTYILEGSAPSYRSEALFENASAVIRDAYAKKLGAEKFNELTGSQITFAKEMLGFEMSPVSREFFDNLLAFSGRMFRASEEFTALGDMLKGISLAEELKKAEGMWDPINKDITDLKVKAKALQKGIKDESIRLAASALNSVYSDAFSAEYRASISSPEAEFLRSIRDNKTEFKVSFKDLRDNGFKDDFIKDLYDLGIASKHGAKDFMEFIEELENALGGTIIDRDTDLVDHYALQDKLMKLVIFKGVRHQAELAGKQAIKDLRLDDMVSLAASTASKGADLPTVIDEFVSILTGGPNSREVDFGRIAKRRSSKELVDIYRTDMANKTAKEIGNYSQWQTLSAKLIRQSVIALQKNKRDQAVAHLNRAQEAAARARAYGEQYNKMVTAKNAFRRLFKKVAVLKAEDGIVHSGLAVRVAAELLNKFNDVKTQGSFTSAISKYDLVTKSQLERAQSFSTESLSDYLNGLTVVDGPKIDSDLVELEPMSWKNLTVNQYERLFNTLNGIIEWGSTDTNNLIVDKQVKNLIGGDATIDTLELGIIDGLNKMDPIKELKGHKKILRKSVDSFSRIASNALHSLDLLTGYDDSEFAKRFKNAFMLGEMEYLSWQNKFIEDKKIFYSEYNKNVETFKQIEWTAEVNPDTNPKLKKYIEDHNLKIAGTFSSEESFRTITSIASMAMCRDNAEKLAANMGVKVEDLYSLIGANLNQKYLDALYLYLKVSERSFDKLKESYRNINFKEMPSLGIENMAPASIRFKDGTTAEYAAIYVPLASFKSILTDNNIEDSVASSMYNLTSGLGIDTRINSPIPEDLESGHTIGRVNIESFKMSHSQVLLNFGYLENAITNTANFAYKAPMVKTLVNLLKRPSVKTAFINANGIDMWMNLVENVHYDIASNPQEKQWGAGIAKKLNHLTYLAVLPFNIKVAISQLAAYPQMAIDIADEFRLNKAQVFAQVASSSRNAIFNGDGNAGVSKAGNLKGDISEAIELRTKEAPLQYGSLKIWNVIRSNVHKFTEIPGMYLIKLMDSLSIASGYRTAYDLALKRGESTKEAHATATRVIGRSQSLKGSTYTRPNLARQSNLATEIISFMAQMARLFGERNATAIRKYTAGKMSKLGAAEIVAWNTIPQAVLVTVITPMLTSIFTSSEEEDEKDYWDKVFKGGWLKVGMKTVGASLGGSILYEMVGEPVLAAMTGQYSTGGMSVPAVDVLVRSVGKASKALRTLADDTIDVDTKTDAWMTFGWGLFETLAISGGQGSAPRALEAAEWLRRQIKRKLTDE